MNQNLPLPLLFTCLFILNVPARIWIIYNMLTGMVPSSWKTNSRERGDYLFSLPAGLLFKLNHCVVAAPVCAVCADREAQLVPNAGASPATARYATLQWAAVVEMHRSLWSACSAGSTQQTGVHSNHIVSGKVHILQIKYMFKIWQPHLILWGSGCCSGLHSFWTLNCSLLCKLMMLNSTVQATSLEQMSLFCSLLLSPEASDRIFSDLYLPVLNLEYSHEFTLLQPPRVF